MTRTLVALAWIPAALVVALVAVAGCDSQAANVSDGVTATTQIAAQEANVEPTTATTATTEKATFGAGCFWGVEAEFRKLPGVISTAVGYAGGTTQRPTYEQVCSDDTGHAEVVQVEFDPSQISYEKLLDAFWELHDPTTLNRQGPDFGSQYRSAVFYHGPQQKARAEASKRKLEEAKAYDDPIVTQIQPAPTFWAAEDYHQQYLEKRGLASCHVNLKKPKNK